MLYRGVTMKRRSFLIKDREQYLSLLKKYVDKWNSPILAYCLMSNHVHLLTRPKEEESLYKMMQGVTLCYTQYMNRKYKRTGRLWESRYHSCIVDKEKYIWAVARCIEQNPTRVRIVKTEEDFLYSSARAHIKGVRDDILGKDLFEERQRKDYGEFIRAGIPEEEKNRIRYSTRAGRPFGSGIFIKNMEKKLGRRFILKPPGRPRKKKGK
jgi:putative transposase